MDRYATYTTIVHSTREESGLSVIEFYAADVIDKLSNPKCTMGREKLADLCGLSRRGFGAVVDRLVDCGYVEKDRQSLWSTQAWRDLVYVQRGEETAHPRGKKCLKNGQKVPLEGEETAHVYNYNDINKDNIVVETSEKPNQLPGYFGHSPLQRVVMAYSILWYHLYGTKYEPNFGMIGKVYKPILEQLTEMQVAALILIHFNWSGADGTDDFAHRRLVSNMFPINWIPKNVNEYKTYLTNVLGVNFEDQDAVKAYVKESLTDALRAAVENEIVIIPKEK